MEWPWIESRRWEVSD